MYIILENNKHLKNSFNSEMIILEEETNYFEIIELFLMTFARLSICYFFYSLACHSFASLTQSTDHKLLRLVGRPALRMALIRHHHSTVQC